MINIWCYWSQGKSKLSYLPKLCVNNWKKHLTNNFKINIIDKKQFLGMQNEIDKSFFNKLTYQQQSDVVRLYLLYNYGGIWIDITSILTSDLSWVIDKFKRGYKIVAFNVNYSFQKKSKYLLENWFIAVNKPYNYIIFNWKKTFLSILNQGLKNNGIKNSNIWKETDKSTIVPIARVYLSMHIANLWCVQNEY